MGRQKRLNDRCPLFKGFWALGNMDQCVCRCVGVSVCSSSTLGWAAKRVTPAPHSIQGRHRQEARHATVLCWHFENMICCCFPESGPRCGPSFCEGGHSPYFVCRVQVRCDMTERVSGSRQMVRPFSLFLYPNTSCRPLWRRTRDYHTTDSAAAWTESTDRCGTSKREWRQRTRKRARRPGLGDGTEEYPWRSSRRRWTPVGMWPSLWRICQVFRWRRCLAVSTETLWSTTPFSLRHDGRRLRRLTTGTELRCRTCFDDNRELGSMEKSRERMERWETKVNDAAIAFTWLVIYSVGYWLLSCRAAY